MHNTKYCCCNASKWPNDMSLKIMLMMMKDKVCSLCEFILSQGILGSFSSHFLFFAVKEKVNLKQCVQFIPIE